VDIVGKIPERMAGRRLPRQRADVSYQGPERCISSCGLNAAANRIVRKLGMPTIFRKTAKGVDEVATRANRLVPRLRTALILVDGSRSSGELGKLIPQDADATLMELVRGGYIEAAGEVPSKPVRAAAPATGEGELEGSAFNKFRAEAVRAFNDLTGPTGEALAMKMEKTATREQLGPLLQTAYQIIANARGNQAALEFKARFATF